MRLLASKYLDLAQVIIKFLIKNILSDEDTEQVRTDKAKVIDNFKDFWYKKKCSRELHIPWKTSRKSIQSHFLNDSMLFEN